MWKVPRWDYKPRKIRFEVEYEGEDLVPEEKKTFVFG